MEGEGALPPQSKGFDRTVFETELLQSTVSRFYVH